MSEKRRRKAKVQGKDITKLGKKNLKIFYHRLLMVVAYLDENSIQPNSRVVVPATAIALGRQLLDPVDYCPCCCLDTIANKNIHPVITCYHAYC